MRPTSFWRFAGTAAVLLGFFAAPLSAQFSLGAKAGINFAKFGGDLTDLENIDWRSGFVGGASLTYSFEGIALQPELLLVQKGSKWQVTEEDLIKGDMKITYVEMPLLMKVLMPVGENRLAAPFLMVGPSFAYQTSCEVTGTVDNVKLTVDCDEEPFEAELNKFDWSAVLGGGFGIPVGQGAITLDARYVYGFRNIDGSDDPDDVKNRSFAAMLGFTFPVGGGNGRMAGR